jgi:putative hydrolase of the HAD superfamily
MLTTLELMLNQNYSRLPKEVLSEVMTIGRSLLNGQVELLAGVETALQSLRGKVELVLVTKGDLFHQEAKIARSGIESMFDRIEIVSDKRPATYSRIFGPISADEPRAAMVGNSVRSDILPAIEAGLWALHVPHDMIWDHEVADVPTDQPLYRHFTSLGDAVVWLHEMV